jgi:hypothetical protein
MTAMTVVEATLRKGQMTSKAAEPDAGSAAAARAATMRLLACITENTLVYFQDFGPCSDPSTAVLPLGSNPIQSHLAGCVGNASDPDTCLK